MKYSKDKKCLVQVRLSEPELEKIDWIATTEKRSRSEVIRLLIANGGLSYGKTSEKVAI